MKPHEKAQAATEANEYPPVSPERVVPESATCNTFWGSHGCDLPKGHEQGDPQAVHVCDSTSGDGPCSQMVKLDTTLRSGQPPEGRAKVRFYEQTGELSTWSDGWSWFE